MVNNYKIIEIIREYLQKQKEFDLNNISIKTIEYFFLYLISHKNKFNTAYLLNYLYKNISNKEVAKRKTTARDFEDYLAIIFNGIITDQINRTNQNIQGNNIFVENQFITNFVLSNRREKADLIFPNNYELSVKTLIESNQEINLGSFEKTAEEVINNIDEARELWIETVYYSGKKKIPSPSQRIKI